MYYQLCPEGVDLKLFTNTDWQIDVLIFFKSIMLEGFDYAPDQKISICIPRVFCFLITKILYSNHYYFATVLNVCLSTDLGLPTSDSSSSAFVAAASAAWLRPAASLSLLLPLPADWPLLFLLPDLFKCLLPGDLSRRNLK